MARTPNFPGLYWDKKTGKGTIDKRIGGTRFFRRFEAGTREEAERIYLDALTKQPVTAEPAREPQRHSHSATAKTFLEAATKYLQEETKTSIDRDAGSLEILAPWIGALPLDRIHQGTLQPFIDARRDAGIKSGTVRRDLRIVGRILALASRVWRDEWNRPWLATAPPLIRMPDWQDDAKPYPLAWEEQRRLIQALPSHLASMALFAVNTGVREQVVCSLRWEWETRMPELGCSVFVVPGRPNEAIGWEGTKTKADAVIVLNHAARNVIEAQRGQHQEWVFVYRGERIERINNSAWRRAWRNAALPAGRDTLAGPHNLRHTFARRLRQAGVPLETRKALLGHEDGDITLHYSPAELRELITAVEKIGDTDVGTMLRVVAA